MTETRSFDAFVLNFEHLIFEFVSDFGFRASNLFIFNLLCPLMGGPISCFDTFTSSRQNSDSGIYDLYLDF
jgi:hypothetical protein